MQNNTMIKNSGFQTTLHIGIAWNLKTIMPTPHIQIFRFNFYEAKPGRRVFLSSPGNNNVQPPLITSDVEGTGKIS